MFEEGFYVLRIFDSLCLMTHVSSGDRKGVIFLMFSHV